MPRTSLLFILLVLAAGSLAAQDPPGTISLHLRPLIFRAERAAGEYYLHDLAAEEGTPGLPIKLKSYLNHEEVSLFARGRKLVVTADKNPSSARKAESVLGTIALPDGLRRAVLLFLPGPRGKGWKVVPLDDSTRKFPPGSIRVINLSPYPMRMQLEKEVFNLKSGENRVIEDPPVGENNHAALRIHVFQDEEWKQIGASTLPHPGTRRLIQILHENPATRRVELKGIRDVSIPDPS